MSDPMSLLGGPAYVQTGRLRSRKGSTAGASSLSGSCFPCAPTHHLSSSSFAGGGGKRNNLLRAEGSLSSTGCLRFNVPLLPLPGQQYSQQSPEKLKLKYGTLYTPRWSQAVRRARPVERLNRSSFERLNRSSFERLGRSSLSPSLHRDVVALNDPTFMTAVIERENARRARKQDLLLGPEGRNNFSPIDYARHPGFSALYPMAAVQEDAELLLQEEAEAEASGEASLELQRRAASHTGLTARAVAVEDDAAELHLPAYEANPYESSSPTPKRQAAASPPLTLTPPAEEIDLPAYEPGSRGRLRVAALQTMLGGDLIVERHGKKAPHAAPFLARAGSQDEEAVTAARKASAVRLLIPTS